MGSPVVVELDPVADHTARMLLGLVADVTFDRGPDLLRPGTETGHASVLLLPLQASNERAFLDTSSVPKPILITVGEVMSKTRSFWRDPYTAFEVLRVTRMLFFRAYADGLKTILRRYLATPLECPRLMQCQCAPSLMITWGLVGVSQIRIVWTRSSSERSRAPPT